METVNPNTTEKLKVLIICPFARPNIGGVESHIEKLMTYCTKHGVFPVLQTYQPLTNPGIGLSHEITPSHEIYRTSWFGRGLFPKIEDNFVLSFGYLFPGLFISSLFYLAKNHKDINCIHAHGLASAAIALIFKYLFGKKIILSTHAIYSFKSRPLLAGIIKFMLNKFDVVLAVSEFAKVELVALGITRPILGVHKNWVDTDIFRIISSDQLVIKPKFTHNFLFAGRLLEKKGIKLFLELAALYPGVGFNIFGIGPLQTLVLEFAEKYSNITYFGGLNQADSKDLQKIISLYNICDYLISPYSYDEGFATVLLESMSCGTPVIATKRGSPPTFLDPNNTIYLDNPPTVQGLSVIIDKLISDPLKSKTMDKSRSCREYVIKNFGFNNAKEIINYYE